MTPQMDASRELIDLPHFVFSANDIGRLKVLSTSVVAAGDSFELDAVGALRLSPLRRGLAVDSNVDFFTFYVPLRHVYQAEWVNFMRAGMSAQPLKPESCYPEIWGSSFLGVHPSKDYTLPKYYYQSYLQIWNNFFKAPWMPDETRRLADLDEPTCRGGFRCCHLKNIWSAPLPPNTQTHRNYNVEVNSDFTGAVDIMGLQAVYAQLHTEQERSYFATRYRDIVESFGGSTTIDADNRPKLLMRTNTWASGYDVDGTDQSSLGQFSGRVQQSFHHSVPRFFVPEHGVIMTLCLTRFPPTCTYENPLLVNLPSISYDMIALDPAIVGNSIPVKTSYGSLFHQGPTGISCTIAHSQWLRYQNSHVDYNYHELQGFPFISKFPKHSDLAGNILVEPNQYDHCFQSTQLGHYSIQSKFNARVYRNMPTVRDSIMTS
ncbi:major capsid protein [Lelliottia sp. SL45]|uniref:major capsid protein n=1 Tax=Lelliottia sp. SL45 TaxID=2994665 RepID=UPI002274BA70|nr:major capsid protein [Lelliottia sp. SL45]MCY1701127.1 major capsid protein [Lelliottia sp. SL45]